AAIAGGTEMPFAKMSVTCWRTRSAANAGSRSYWFSAKRYSIATLRPSSYPISLRPSRKATSRWASAPGARLVRNPTTGSPDCGVSAEHGHATATVPRSLRTARRFTGVPHLRQMRLLCDLARVYYDILEKSVVLGERGRVPEPYG